MSKKLLAHAAVLGANVLYGINYLAVKEIVPDAMHPHALSVMRAMGALILLWGSFAFVRSQKVDPKDWYRLVIAGILGVAINQTLLIVGINKTSSINASIIMTSNPLFVMLFAAIFLRNKITKLKVLGVLLGGSGAALLIYNSARIDINSSTIVGDMIILTNSVMYAVYLIWMKPLMRKYDAFTVMRWMFLFGSGFVLLFGGGEFMSTDFASFSPQVWYATAFVVVGATFLTYLLNVYGLQHVNPSTVSIYINLQPIVASLAAILLARDHLDTVRVVSMLLVIAGVYCVSTTNTTKLSN